MGLSGLHLLYRVVLGHHWMWFKIRENCNNYCGDKWGILGEIRMLRGIELPRRN